MQTQNPQEQIPVPTDVPQGTNTFYQLPPTERLVYNQPYRDVFFGVLFVAMLLALLISCIVMYAGDSVSSIYGDVIGILIALMVIGALGGVGGLMVVRCIPETIIQILLFGMIALYIVAGIVSIAVGITALAVIFFIFAAFFIIYTYCIWWRIPFAAALLWISSRIVTKYTGVIWTAIAAMILEFFFQVLWILVVIKVVVLQSEIGYFLMVICFYWGVLVFSNISHTTSCGVAAAWYFNADAQSNVTWNSFKRAMTTSFGTICFGSLIVAIIEAIRSSARNAKNGRGGGSLLCCICLCLLSLCEAFLRFFTEYSFVYVAIYGKSFYESARMTWQLLQYRGWWTIINNSLVNLALYGGSLVAGIISGIIGVLIGVAIDNEVAVMVVLGIIGWIVGMFMAHVILHPVKSGVATLFVAYAEDPEILQKTHPDEYTRLTNANPQLIVTTVQVVTVVQPVQQQVVFTQGGQPQQYVVQTQQYPMQNQQYQMQPQQYQMQPQQYQMQNQQYQTQPQYQMQMQQQYQMQPQYQVQPQYQQYPQGQQYPPQGQQYPQGQYQQQQSSNQEGTL